MNNKEAIEAIKNNYPPENYKMLREALDLAINTLQGINGKTSDGFHTFDELYYHRMILFSIICSQNKDNAWKSKLHKDGTMYDNYFIVGVTTSEGDYTYHYHFDNWNYFDVRELPTAPDWDGHKPDDITRLLSLL